MLKMSRKSHKMGLHGCVIFHQPMTWAEICPFFRFSQPVEYQRLALKWHSLSHTKAAI
jgi:hypothetical protein